MRARAHIVKNSAQARWIAVAAGLAAALTATEVPAHFNLKSPASWAMQNSLGDPQKSAPCGQADPNNAAQPTNVVTPFAPGETVTITLVETVPHPGHYRVALARTRAELPADPPVTAGSTACGSTVIQQNPTFPILADGALAHTSSLGSGVQSIQVTLPTDITCEKCTLQVIEFMSNHGLNNPGGCFYHHCADISIGMGGGGGAGGGGGKSGGGNSSGLAGGGGRSGGGSANGGSGGAGGNSAGGNAGGSGASSGGTSSGGASVGGASGAAGMNSGAGGAASGGTSSGGTSSGGATSGGSTAGGTSAGGATSGATSGGASTGGANVAGQAPGGAGGAEEGCGCSVPGGHGGGGAGLALAGALATWLAARRGGERRPNAGRAGRKMTCRERRRARRGSAARD